MHLWKGLFFCMWMSDKPLTQEKLAENLASLLHCFDKKDVSIRFYGAFLKIMGKEWFGIDQWRIDKFMMVKTRPMRHFCFQEKIVEIPFALFYSHSWFVVWPDKFSLFCMRTNGTKNSSNNWTKTSKKAFWTSQRPWVFWCTSPKFSSTNLPR